MGIETGWDEWDNLHLILDERASGFTRWAKNFVMKGLGLTPGVGLQAIAGEPGLNFAYVNGYEIKQTGAVALGLAPSTTNHVFLKFTKTPDITAGTAAITISYTVNTTGIPPADSIKLGEVDTDGIGVTAIRNQNNKFKLHDTQLETDLDCNQLQLKRYTPEKGTAFPTVPPPVSGEHFVRIDLIGNPEFIFDGVMWNAIGTGGPGAQGNQGFQGAGGGAQGAQGNQGRQGNQGNQGNQGISGPQGSQGYQGFFGPQGLTGSGVQGAQGSGGLGLQGSQGAQGAQGLLSPDIYAATRVADPSGNGTDLTIAAAIAALPATGGTIFFKGLHAIGATQVLPNKNIVLRGEGCGSAKIEFSGTGPLFSQANSDREFSIEHALIDGLSTGVTQKVFLASGDDIEAYFSHVMIVGFHDVVQDTGLDNEFVFLYSEAIMPAFGTFDQKFYDGVASGELVWDYMEVSFTEASDRFAFGGTDAIVGAPKWVVNHSYIGGPPPAISTFEIGQAIIDHLRADKVLLFVAGERSIITGFEGLDARINLDGPKAIVRGSTFRYVSGGIDPFIEINGTDCEVAICDFDGVTLMIEAILVATDFVRLKVHDCRFDGFSSRAIHVGNSTSGTVQGNTFIDSGNGVVEGNSACDFEYIGNRGWVANPLFLIGENSRVEGVLRKSLTGVATAGAFVTQFEHQNRKGVVGIGTIKNTGGNSLEVRETVTDAFGVTDSVTTPVPSGNDYLLDPQTNFGTARPPHLSYKVDVRHPGAATTFSLQHATEGAE